MDTMDAMATVERQKKRVRNDLRKHQQTSSYFTQEPLAANVRDTLFYDTPSIFLFFEGLAEVIKKAIANLFDI